MNAAVDDGDGYGGLPFSVSVEGAGPILRADSVSASFLIVGGFVSPCMADPAAESPDCCPPAASKNRPKRRGVHRAMRP